MNTSDAQPFDDDEPILDAELDDDEPLIEAELDDDDSDEIPTKQAETYQWVLSKNAKLRLDKYLNNRLKGISRSKIQQLIDLGMVTVNNQQPKSSTKLHQGDVVDVRMPPRPSFGIEPEPIDIEVIYEDADMVVINKPANIIVHPARGQMSGTILNALAWRFQQQAKAQGETSSLSNVGAHDARPGVVHRLDKNTTGVMVVAKRDETHWKLSKQFEKRTNLKCYLAVVHGCPDPVGGAIEEPLGRHPTVHEAMAVRHDSVGKHSLTLYRVRERYKGYSLIELELKTGRTHQIRVHLEYLGHPIVGDVIYGGEPIGLPELDDPPRAKGGRAFLNFATSKPEGLKIYEQIDARDDIIMASPALHATLLRLDHPVTGESQTFTAPVPSPMRDLIAELRKRPEAGPVVEKGWWVDLDKALPKGEIDER